MLNVLCAWYRYGASMNCEFAMIWRCMQRDKFDTGFRLTRAGIVFIFEEPYGN